MKTTIKKYIFPFADKEGEIAATFNDILLFINDKGTHDNKIGYLSNGVRVLLRDTTFEKLKEKATNFVRANKSSTISKYAHFEIENCCVVITDFLIDGKKLRIKLTRTCKKAFYKEMHIERLKSGNKRGKGG